MRSTKKRLFLGEIPLRYPRAKKTAREKVFGLESAIPRLGALKEAQNQASGLDIPRLVH
jgi:hypothetical protein